ncbi:unnamed protein product, partial [Ectocarpus sp. 4 AP-2014]
VNDFVKRVVHIYTAFARSAHKRTCDTCPVLPTLTSPQCHDWNYTCATRPIQEVLQHPLKNFNEWNTNNKHALTFRRHMCTKQSLTAVDIQSWARKARPVRHEKGFI